MGWPAVLLFLSILLCPNPVLSGSTGDIQREYRRLPPRRRVWGILARDVEPLQKSLPLSTQKIGVCMHLVRIYWHTGEHEIHSLLCGLRSSWTKVQMLFRATLRPDPSSQMIAVACRSSAHEPLSRLKAVNCSCRFPTLDVSSHEEWTSKCVTSPSTASGWPSPFQSEWLSSKPLL